MGLSSTATKKKKKNPATTFRIFLSWEKTRRRKWWRGVHNVTGSVCEHLILNAPLLSSHWSRKESKTHSSQETRTITEYRVHTQDVTTSSSSYSSFPPPLISMCPLPPSLLRPLFLSASSPPPLHGGWLLGALLSDALARSPHLAVQLHHLEHGLLSPAAQMVEQTVVLLGEAVQHTEHIAAATGSQFLLHQL